MGLRVGFEWKRASWVCVMDLRLAWSNQVWAWQRVEYQLKRVGSNTVHISFISKSPLPFLDPSLISLKLSSWLTTRVLLWVFIFKIKFSYFYNPYLTLKFFFVSFTYDSRFKVVHCIDIILIYRNFLRLSTLILHFYLLPQPDYLYN